MKKFIFTLACLFWAIGVSSQAQNVNDSIREKHLSEVEVLATRRPSATLSTTPLQIISNERILQEGMSSLADAARKFNGIVLKDYGGIGGIKTVSIRGMGAEHTAVSYDGIMVSNALAGQIDIGRFSLDNVSMVSLHIGQSDNIFHTAKSFASAGSLNIQTSAPNFTDKNYKAHARITSGSFGLVNPTIDYSHRLSDKIAVSVNGGYLRADNQYKFKLKEDLLYPNRKRYNNAIKTYNTEVNLYGDFGKGGKLTSKAYFYGSDRGIPGAVIVGNDVKNTEDIQDKNFFTQTSYVKDFGKKFKFKSQAKYDYSYSNYRNEFPSKKIETYRQHEVYLSNTLLYNVTDRISASFAQDLFYNKLDGEVGNNPPYPKRYNSLSALALQYDSKRLTITGSLLGTYISEKVKNTSSNNIYRRIAPAISFSVAPFPFTDLRIRASYKSGYRVPTFSETYYSPISSNLKPELAKQFNLGLVWSGNINETISYINVSVDGYYNKVNDKIIIIPTSPIRVSSTNLGKVEMGGVDLKVATNIVLTERINVDMSATYSFMHAVDVTNSTANGSDKYYKDQIQYTPLHSGSASIGFNNPWVNISYTLISSSERYSRNQNISANRISGYTEHSLSLFRNFKLKDNDIYIQGNISNITDKQYDIIRYYPMPGRAYKISVGYKF